MNNPKVFMIMPFDEEFFDAYEMLKEKFSSSFDFCHAGDDINAQQNILKDIVQMIFEADVVIADLTNLNANVFYELGVAHALNKKVIVITQNISQLPFDIKSYRAIEYSTHYKRFENLTRELHRLLQGAVDGTATFGNPVTDFLLMTGIKGNSLIKPEMTEIAIIDEGGFLDFQADIEDQMATFTMTLGQMTSDMNTMAMRMRASTAAVNKAKQTGGSGTASFLRKEAKKVASYINECDGNLGIHISSLVNLWTAIENNCVGLVTSRFAGLDENRVTLAGFLSTLSKLKTAAMGSLGDAQEMIDSFSSLKDIQKELNRAVKAFEIDMNRYTEFVIQLGASIDRILSKGEPVVGIVEPQ